MVDLQSQYQKIKNEVDEKVLNVMQSAQFINGPEVQNFQKELEQYLGVKHVIPCANGTDALQIALMALDLQPGDEVITADFTFAATVEVVHLLKLKSVLVDVDYDTFNIDIEKLKVEYFGDQFAKKMYAYNCSTETLIVAEEKVNYLKNINVKQGELKF